MNPSAAAAPLLSARRITKRFGQSYALRDASVDVFSGEVHALCGENGAGKSTLIRVLSGYFPHGAYEGELRLRGGLTRFHGVRDAERAGISVVHQELALVDGLSAAENIFLGRLPRRGWRVDWRAAYAEARRLLDELHAPIDPETPVGELGVGHRQLVELARALARASSVIILDEPTAALAEGDAALVLSAVRKLRERNVACVYISHKLSEVLEIADRVTVLRDGQAVAHWPIQETSQAQIIHRMVGRAIVEVVPRRSANSVSRQGSTACLRIKGLSACQNAGRNVRLVDISLHVMPGEIVGVGGLLGSGRSELLMHLFGLWGRRLAGEVQVDGHDYAAPRPVESLRRGMVLIHEDRQRMGLVPEQSVDANLSLSSLAAITRFFRMDEIAERRRNSRVLERLSFRGGSPAGAVRRLSGGNQQKVVLGRGILAAPRLLLLDEPTRGVDVAARRELYHFIHELAGDGVGVLLVSSDLAELTAISDRIVMLREGRVGGQFDSPPFDPFALMSAAAP